MTLLEIVGELIEAINIHLAPEDSYIEAECNRLMTELEDLERKEKYGV